MPSLSKRSWLRRRIRLQRVLISSIGGFLAIGVISYLSSTSGYNFLIPSFGASCFIAFIIPDSAFAQPRNIIGGHFLSAAIGLCCLALFGHTWWSYALAVSIAMGAMQLARVLHPPAAADPLLIMTQGPVSWSFLFSPVLSGSILLVAIAFLYNYFRFDPGRTIHFSWNFGNLKKNHKSHSPVNNRL